MSNSAPDDFQKDEKYANYLTSWEFPTVFDEVNNEIKDQKNTWKIKALTELRAKPLTITSTKSKLIVMKFAQIQ